jgi:uncharacterized protein YxeA
MKKILVIISVLLLTLGFYYLPSFNDWRTNTYTSPKSEYSIQFPGPSKQVESLLPHTDARVFTNEKGINFFSAHWYRNLNPGFQSSTDEVMNKLRDGVLLGTRNLGRVESEKKSTINNHPSREISYVDANGNKSKVRIVMTKDLLIYLLVTASGKDVDDPEVSAFFSSLRVQ